MRRASRVAAFGERAAWDEAGAMEVEGLGACVLVHPLADETDLLGLLNLLSERCTKADAYWYVDGDVHFVQVEGGEYSMRTPGVYGRYHGGRAYKRNVVVVVAEASISRTVFERALRDAHAALACTRSLGRALRRIG